MVKVNPIKILPTLIALGVIAIVCVLHILPLIYPNFSLLQELEWKTYDWRVRSAFRTNAESAKMLGAVLIDDDTITEINEDYKFTYPFPRKLYGYVVRELKAQGAKVVGFDILFSELHGSNAAIDFKLSSGLTMTSDEFFARQLNRASNVVLAVMGGESVGNKWQALPPAPLFRTNALALGHITTDTDSDGVLRRALAFRDDPNLGRLWHMGIVLAAEELGIDLKTAVVEPGRITLRNGTGVERVIPTDENGYFYIDWSLTWNDRRILKDSFSSLLAQTMRRAQGQAMDSDWKDRVVVIGSIASGNNVSDTGATPISKHDYLVSKHWNIANSIITGEFVHKSSIVFDLSCIWLLGGISAFLTWRLRVMAASLWVVFLMLAYIAASLTLFVHSRIWIPVVLPVVGALLFTHVCMVTYRVIFEQNERRRVRAVFSKIVSPDVVNELLGSEKLSLGGARRKISVFFADVRGFTEFTNLMQTRAEDYVRLNKLSPEAAEQHFDQMARESLATVNLYLSTIADTIKYHKGTLDKYIGDCVMAFWGAPIANEQHAVGCVQAAIDAQRAMYKLNQERFAENKRREEENKVLAADQKPLLESLPLLSLGSGINSGVAIVGLMGSEDHILNYTVFGPEVNLASRLEAVSGRGRIIIGETTYIELQRHAPEMAATAVALPPTLVKGFKEAVKIYEVPWKETAAEPVVAAATAKPVEADSTLFIPRESTEIKK